MKAVVLLSGGLDSTVLAYFLKSAYDLASGELTALSFNYGQRHKKELVVAYEAALDLEAEHHLIALRVFDMGHPEWAGQPLASILSGSSLTDSSVPVPDGHYAEETMKATVVPNRNAIMLSIAYGVAVAKGAEMVAFAAHAGDHAIYPDCRPEFIANLNTTFRMGNLWAYPLPVLVGPFLSWSKSRIVLEGAKLGVPFEKTWSCYKGGNIHCGTCGTCYERREAFKLADIHDPTLYTDSTTEFAPPS